MEIVPSDQIEGIVGVPRHAFQHWGRAVSAEQRVYILHSVKCVNSGRDLRDCEFSRALALGIDPDDWAAYENQPMHLRTDDGGYLVPYHY